MANAVQIIRKIIRVGESYLAFSDHFSEAGDQRLFCRQVDIDLGSVIAISAAGWLHVGLKKLYRLQPTEAENDAFESTRIDTLIANPGALYQ